MKKITTISISPEVDKFCDERGINISGLVETKIREMMDTSVNPEFVKGLQEEILHLSQTVKNWQNLFYKAKDFISKKGFEEEFSNELAK